MAFNAVLIKRAFKSTFRNRLFTILMFFLVLCSSATYAAFESANQSFSRSYDSLVSSGALHDLVIKENFANDEGLVEVNQFEVSANNYVPLTAANLQTYARPVGASASTYTVRVAVSEDYASYGFSARPSLDVVFTLVNNDFASALVAVQVSAAELQNQVSRRINQFQAKAYAAGLMALYPGELVTATRESVAVNASVRAWKVVSYDAEALVNKLQVYQGTGELSHAQSDAALRAALEARLAALNTGQAPPSSYVINALKGYRVTATNALQQVIGVTDLAALEAIISPSYAAANQKVPISRAALTALINDGWRAYAPNSGASSIIEALAVPTFRAAFASNLIEVDATPYFILGIGAAPDFAYPIISTASPTVDVTTQAIVYVNARGYERIIDSFRTNARENYISVRFASGISAARRAAIFAELSAFMKAPSASIRGVTLPRNLPLSANTNMLTYANDASDALTLTYERTAFLAGLSNTLNTVTIITTTLLALFVAVIVIMVFNVLVGTSRKSLATLLALGHTRVNIAFSTAFISFLIGALPAILGYVIGWGVQQWISDAFSNFWTIPTFSTSFSWLSLVITVALPTICMFGLISFVVWISLLHPLPKMLTDSVWDSAVFVEKMVRAFRILPIRSKYVLALMLRNGVRLLFVSIATTSTAVALLVGMSTIGRGEAAYAETIATSSYEYKIDLYSPTKEGGQYARVSYGLDDSAPVASWAYTQGVANEALPYVETYASTTPSAVRANAHWHVIGPNDALLSLPNVAQGVSSGSSSLFSPADVAYYLKNKVQVKNLIDRAVAGINPWATVRQLMPENQQNQAVQNELDLRSSYQSIINEERLDIASPGDYVTRLLTRQVPLRDSNFAITSALYQPYLLTYNNVVTNADDELYTYLDVALSLATGARNQRITGLANAATMVNIGASNMASLNNYHGAHVPIVINKYASETLQLGVGSVLNGLVNNHLLRNFNDFTPPSLSFEVVGIMNGYNNAPFFTTRAHANAALGMDEQGFNGVFSKHKTSALLSSLPLYSPSGLYLATDQIQPGTPWASVLSNLLANAAVWPEGQRANLASDVNAFINKYSATPLAPLLDSVDWLDVSRQAFASVSALASTLINAIQGVSLLLSIIFTMIVASLIVRMNRKRIATLWALGYRRPEVLRMFSTQFILAIAAALAISIPITFGVLALLGTFIVNFGQILIPFAFAPWAPLVVIVILGTIFVLATTISIYALSPRHALAAFKED